MSRVGSATYETRSDLPWLELLPRYALLEGHLRDKRVLEIGTTDPRALFYLVNQGAERVTGVGSGLPSRSPNDGAQRSVCLVERERLAESVAGQAFDVVHIVDLGVEQMASDDFLDQLVRLVRPDVLLLVGFRAYGASVAELSAGERPRPSLDPRQLERTLLERFPGMRFVQQAPQVAVTIGPRQFESPCPTDAAVVHTRLGGGSHPAFVIGVLGMSVPTVTQHFPMPLAEFERALDRTDGRVPGRSEELAIALGAAQRELELKNQALERLSVQLPRLRAHLERQRELAGNGPTLIEYPTLIEDRHGPSGEHQRTAVRDTRVDRAGDTLISRVPAPKPMESLRQQLDARSEELEASRRDLDEQRQRVDHLRAEREHLVARIEQAESERAAYKFRASNAEVAQRALEIHLDGVKAEVAKMAQPVMAAPNPTKSACTERVILAGRYYEALELNALRMPNKSSVKVNPGETDALREQLAEALASLDAERAQNRRMTKRLGDALDELLANQEALRTLKSEKDRLRAEAAHHRNALSTLESRVQVEEQTRSELKDRLVRVVQRTVSRGAESREVDRLRGELDQTRVEVGRRVQHIRTLERERDGLVQERDAAKAAAAELDRKLQSEGDVSALQEQLEKSQVDVKRAVDEREAALSELFALKTRVQSAETSRLAMKRRVLELESLLAERDQRQDLRREPTSVLGLGH
jgi:hypothetical protein